jgi:NADH:ubiquinone oxidoreductase subunit 6 (subunit J)
VDGREHMEVIVLLAVIAAAVLALAILATRNPVYRPLALGIGFSVLSLPIYMVIASLPIDYTIRIVLQVAVFALIVAAVLATINLQLQKQLPRRS